MREVLASEIFRDRGVAGAARGLLSRHGRYGQRRRVPGASTRWSRIRPTARCSTRSSGRATGNLYKPDGPGAELDDVRRSGLREEDEQGHGRLQRRAGCDRRAARAARRTRQPGARTSKRRFDVDVVPALAGGERRHRELGRLRRDARTTTTSTRRPPAEPSAVDSLGPQFLVSAWAGRGDVWPRTCADHAASVRPWPTSLGPHLAGRATVPGTPPAGGVGSPRLWRSWWAWRSRRTRRSRCMFGNSPSGSDILGERVGDQWPLISTLMADDVYRARYRALLSEAMGGLLSLQRSRAGARPPRPHRAVCRRTQRRAPDAHDPFVCRGVRAFAGWRHRLDSARHKTSGRRPCRAREGNDGAVAL